MSDSIKAILPKPTVDSQAFWDACNTGQLMLPHCNSCDRVFYFPRANCPHCGSADLGSKQASGDATVFSFTHVEVSFYGPDWEGQLPYTPVLVDLAEGPRMLSRLVGDDRADVRIGDALRLVFVPFEGSQLPYFQRA